VAVLQAQDKRFARGSIVLLHGAEAFRRELNGCYASIVDGPLADGRFRLRLGAGDVVVVAPRNIVSVSVHARKRIHA
jgi:hypothetical protein